MVPEQQTTAAATAADDDATPARGYSFCLRDLPHFQRTSQQAAIYELAVQPRRRAKHYVMYARVTAGLTASRDVFRSLFGSVYALCDAVLQQRDDVHICVRRAALTSQRTKASETRRNIHNLYSYAWNDVIKPSTARPPLRRIRKHGITMCSHDLV